MKKSPIPKWPLYVADALMFIAVLAIAYPNIVLLETMSAGCIALCCFMVLCGLATSLAPFYFEFKLEKKSLSENAKKTKENISLIFENLSALQLMIAETREASDSIEEKLAFQIAKDTDLKFEKFQENLQTLRDNVKAKIKEINSAIEALEEKSTDVVANADANVLRLDEIQETIASLKVEIEALQQNEFERENSQPVENVNQTQVAETSVELIDEETSTELIEEQLNNAQETSTTELLATPTEIDDLDFDDVDKQNVQVAEQENTELNEELPEDNEENLVEEIEPQNKLEGLMSKALGNAMSTAGAVEKIINASQAQPEPIQDLNEGETEFVEYDAQEQPSDFDEQQAFNDDVDFNDVDEQIDSTELLSDLDFDEEKKTIDSSEEPQQTSSETEQNFDLVEEKNNNLNQTSTKNDGFLFEIEEPEKKARITKKDTVITLHALIGIGNSPYIRGDNSVLTQEKGMPMEYVEIGVWRAIVPPFEGELNFSIWKNDEFQIGENSYTIAAGKKQEITI